MSIKVMTWVWDHSTSGGNDRLVLLAIADHASDDGGQAWPSIARLATKANISVRTVKRCIQTLEELGELKVDRGTGRATSQYTVVMTPGEGCQSVTPDPGDNPTPQGAQIDTPGVSDCHPRGDTVGTQTVLEPSVNRQGTKDGTTTAAAAVSSPPIGTTSSGTKGHRLPKDWKRTEADLSWQAEREIPEAFARIAGEEFRNHWWSVPGARGSKLDWSRTWQNWLSRDWNGARGATWRRERTGKGQAAPVGESLVEANRRRREENRRRLG